MSPLFKKTPKSAEKKEEPKNKEGTGISGIFSGKDKKPGPTPEIVGELSNISRRIRILEDRYNNLRNQLQFADEIVLRNRREMDSEIQAIDMTLSDLNREVSEIKDRAAKMSSEIKGSAKHTDLKLLEKYVDLWKPVEFLTKEQAVKMIKEYAEKRR